MPRPATRRTCEEFPNCGKKYYAKSKCYSHYYRDRYATHPEFRQPVFEASRRHAATPEAKEKERQSDLRWAETNREKKRRHALNSFHRLRVSAARGEVDESLDVFSVFIELDIFSVFTEEDFVCQICFEPCDPASYVVGILAWPLLITSSR
jgi:hypothetical protein